MHQIMESRINKHINITVSKSLTKPIPRGKVFETEHDCTCLLHKKKKQVQEASMSGLLKHHMAENNKENCFLTTQKAEKFKKNRRVWRELFDKWNDDRHYFQSHSPFGDAHSKYAFFGGNTFQSCRKELNTFHCNQY